MKRFLRAFVPPLACCAALSAQAEDVHLVEQTAAGGTTNVIRTMEAGTGTNSVSLAAPSIDNFLFVYWTMSTEQTYSTHDPDGRAYDALPFVLYEDTTLTARYLPDAEDADNDGIPDGWEWYWYGGLQQTANADTDGDGYDFEAELAAGINPHFRDSHTAGVVLSDGDEVLYNPNGLEPYTIRSEPEDELFATIIDYVAVGTRVFTPTGDCQTTTFAYWTQDGVALRDGDGRALDFIVFTMPDRVTELVAHTEADEVRRMALYWYGTPDAPQDADGDGYTFAQEVAAGLDPNFADAHTLGVFWDDSGMIDYNPHNLQAYTMRSEPEGELFATIRDYATVGAEVTTPACDRDATTFAYWTQDGTEMRDGDGRALDQVTFAMPAEGTELVAHTETNDVRRMELYWHGAGVVPEDADGDGYAFRAELDAGLNPNFVDEHVNGVVWADGDTLEVNLQVYEQAQGALMGGTYSTFFSSPIAGTVGELFGANAAPAILDWNGDGRRDLVVAFRGGIRVFVNNGTAQNPDLGETTVPPNLATAFASIDDPLVAGDGTNALYFASRADTNVWRFALGDRSIAPTGKTGLFGVRGELALLADMTLDVPLDKGVSIGFADADGDGSVDMLGSDEDGRIWFYRGLVGGHVLQHKVWGGSREGFANGLKIAPTDWDDDGDLDCVCGTAEGRLMLLGDPRGGRPANVTLSAGADTVSIKWDPQAQSRIRGYYVYRRERGGETWARLESTALPRFLDKPPEGAEAYEYRVTSVSRFYTTGNSKPTMVESAATDPQSATLAQVAFTWRPAAGFAGDDVTVDFAVENAMNLSASNLVLRISYDPAVLAPVEVVRTGLTEGLEFVETRAAGSWLVSGTGGSIAPGTGKFLSFTFAVADGQALADAQVTVEEFTLKSVSNRTVVPNMVRNTGDLAVEDFDPDDASQVPAGSLGDLDGDGRLGWNDVELLLRWKDADRDDVPEAIRRAGDYNGDGRLDNRDYLLMRRHYRACAKRGGRMTGWDENHGYRGDAR